MKTKTNYQKEGISGIVSVMIAVMMLFSKGVAAQDLDSTRTLFKSGISVREVWTPEVKLNSIQGSAGTLIGFTGGTLFNNTFLLGISGGVNLGHPTVNYGYFGGTGQVIFRASELMHFSCQLLIAYGTTKDYEHPKSGLLDNFWNISGAGFFMLEPGVNIELNISKGITLVAGVSYRNVSGLNESNENIQITHVTSRDLSGVNLNIGIRFGKRTK